ncbi:ribonuclease HIII [Priestia koreensis]|uniref:ribonuclease HIII n=1 Tax=Priestia koreensis TaxID=284581 RepID=UPI001F5A3F3C|nr:ribonuclease HIII [Priestia koreensis]MCM3002747.1 ribonuclease HIII [Priestia koreensis]UNL84444.1 ribonuclease HIII [Priestia koreensis]
MANAVLKVQAPQLREIQSHYAPFITDKTPPGGVFTAKLPNCTITAYKSGKVLFQGNGAEQEAQRWGTTESSAPAKGPSASSLPANFHLKSVIGSDEVGTGDFFGPITVVAAYVSKEQIPLLKELGVRDSKDLKDPKIIEIARQLLHVVPYSLIILHNPKYNDLQKSGMSQGKMKAILHNKAIQNVLNKIAPEEPEAILIDQFVEGPTYYKHVAQQKEVVKKNVFFSTKGESIHLSVAAASIIARYAFLREMDKLGKKAGVELPKGAGKHVDIAAAKIIQSQGTDVLKDLTKHHFANTEKAIRLAHK